MIHLSPILTVGGPLFLLLNIAAGLRIWDLHRRREEETRQRLISRVIDY